MGLIKLSQKAKRSPVIGARYWSDRQMFDFMPSVAYDVPFEGQRPDEATLAALWRKIAVIEQDQNPDTMVGVHIEAHDQGYLTITIGAFAT